MEMAISSVRAPDVTEGMKVEIAGFAKGSDVLIENECRVHDDTETSDLLRELDLSVTNFDGIVLQEMYVVADECQKEWIQTYPGSDRDHWNRAKSVKQTNMLAVDQL